MQPPDPDRRSRTLRHVLDRRFRANPAFALVAPERLPERYRPHLAGNAAQATGEKVLVSRSALTITAKVLNAGAVQLVQGLDAAGHLPDDARAGGGAAANEAVARLVLDGALEIEDGGRFVSGPRAHGALFATVACDAGGGTLAELSLRAVRYGQALSLSGVAELSRRLYGFGTIPRSPRWEHFAEPGALGLTREGHALAAYEGAVHRGWLAWTRANGDTHERRALPFKLYVSPRPEAFAESLPAVIGILSEHEVRSFKVGRGVLGALRSDKLVAYLEDSERLDRLACALARALDGCPAHGVPFTAEASADGLLSWGMDPPSTERLLDAQPHESWRLWVTNRLASSLIHAQAAPGGVAPWEFALDRLTLEGVDPSTWLPADTIWPLVEPR